MNTIFCTWLATFSIAASIVSTADQRVYPPHNPVRRTHNTPLEYYLDHLDEFTKQAAGQKRARRSQWMTIKLSDFYSPPSFKLSKIVYMAFRPEVVAYNKTQPPRRKQTNSKTTSEIMSRGTNKARSQLHFLKKEYNPRARLDSYDPDSEVELIEPNQPQPPNPMVLSIPHIVPGQKVFVVHVPVTGYRPITYHEDNFRYRGHAYPYPHPVVLDPQIAPIGSVLDYDKDGIIPPNEMGSSFQRPYDFFPNPKPGSPARQVASKNHQELIRLLNEAKYTNPLHRLVYQKPMDPVEEFSNNNQRNYEPSKRIADGYETGADPEDVEEQQNGMGMDTDITPPTYKTRQSIQDRIRQTFNADQYATLSPPKYRESHGPLITSKQNYYLHDPFAFFSAKPSREQVFGHNPARFLFVRANAPIQEQSTKRVNTAYELSNAVIVKRPDFVKAKVLVNVPKLNVSQNESSFPWSLHRKIVHLPGNGTRRASSEYRIDDTNQMRNTLSRLVYQKKYAFKMPESQNKKTFLRKYKALN